VVVSDLACDRCSARNSRCPKCLVSTPYALSYRFSDVIIPILFNFFFRLLRGWLQGLQAVAPSPVHPESTL
jgi:hypothetical protein